MNEGIIDKQKALLNKKLEVGGLRVMGKCSRLEIAWVLESGRS